MLEVTNLSISFPHTAGRLRAVENIDFSIEKGKVLTLIGESGSGKTLTGLSLMGLLPGGAQATGRIVLEGREISGISEEKLRHIRGRDIAMVYQNPLSALNPVWPVGEQIAEAVLAHGLATHYEAGQRAIALLGRVGIPGPERVSKLYPFEISGGMRQRVVIAMALACNPRLIIADEPTTALDVTIKAQILDLLADLVAQEQISVLLITHDMHVVARLADDILVLYAGRMAERGHVRDLLDHPAHPYTAGLLRSADIRSRPPQTDLEILTGQPPRIGNFPTGCRFHPRCPSSGALCPTRSPDFTQLLSSGQAAACHYPAISADRLRQEQLS